MNFAKRWAVLVGVLSFVGTATTTAQTTNGPTLQVRSLAASCAACHGTDGAAVPGAAMVALAGYPRDALIAQMKAFRDGSRPATVMQQIARGYSDRQIEVLAGYFASMPARQP